MLAMEIHIARLDLLIVVVYLVGIVTLGCLAGAIQRRGITGGRGYFLAGGTLSWPIIGLALFSTNISTIHLVSQAQEGYLNGLAYGNFEWMAPFTLIALSLFFAPFYIRSRVTTLPDFLEKRYGPACRNWLAVLSIVSAIFVHIGFSLYTGAVVLKGLFGVPIMHSVIAVSLLTGLYTIIGGLLAVVLTESVQTIIMLAGAILITAVGYHRVGGWDGLAASVEPVKLTMLRSADDPANLPWYAVFLGYPVIGLWYWCADQTIVQRVLGAKDENHARVGPLFAGFIKILPVFIFVLPGTLGLGLINQGRLPRLPLQASASPAQAGVELSPVEQEVYDAVAAYGIGGDSAVPVEQVTAATGRTVEEVLSVVRGEAGHSVLREKSEDIYAHLITKLLPVGLVGVVVAALLAALMSTVSGALNSIATLFSYDIYKQLRPQASDRDLVRMGKIVTFIAMVVAVAWTPFLSHYQSIYQGVSTLICYIAPPITAVFVWGVFWRRASAAAATATLALGSALGFIVFLLDWHRDVTGWHVPFMMAGFYLFVTCSAVMVLVSHLAPARLTDEAARLCWRNPLEALKGPAWPGLGNFRFLSALLFVTMIVLYVVFR